jgi:hypothetical protein
MHQYLNFGLSLCVVLILQIEAARSDEPSSIIQADALYTQALTAPLYPIRVPLQINGKQAWFLLDTGSSNTVLDHRLARQFKSTGRSIRLQTRNGSVRAEMMLVDRLSLCDIQFEGVKQLPCIDLAPVRELIGVGFDGILGMDVLKDYALVLGFDDATLQLCRSGSILQKPVPEVDLRINSSNSPVVNASLAKEEAQFPFVLDTGCMHTGTFSEELVKVALRNQYVAGTGLKVRTFGPTGDLVACEPMYCNRLNFGRFKHQSLVFIPDDINTLGLDYLSRFNIAFDFPKSVVYVTPSRIHNARDRHDFAGMVLSENDEGRLVVSHLTRQSIAAGVGVQVGDVIVAFNGNPIGELGKAEFWRRFETCSNRPHGIVVSRGESLKNFLLP